ncbi:hypothetical protein B0H12DRAFT_1143297 [Mycena haematopus]|nr:hypothetical protein B0H12DRAFT_1143297 [Mycena haematopus]
MCRLVLTSTCYTCSSLPPVPTSQTFLHSHTEDHPRQSPATPRYTGLHDWSSVEELGRYLL